MKERLLDIWITVCFVIWCAAATCPVWISVLLLLTHRT